MRITDIQYSMKKGLLYKEKREVDQFELYAFSHEAYNRLDVVTDETISFIRTKIDKVVQDYEEWQRIQKEEPERWKELAEQADRQDIDLEGQVDGLMLDTVYYEEEMTGLMEMKIIYAYKHLEINLKRLIAFAYPGTDTKSFYQWTNMASFLKAKSIDVSTLEGYYEVIQLQQVNNKAKHTGLVEGAVKEIPEFRLQDGFTVENLEAFYARVKSAPTTFLKSLNEAISREIYHFDNAKIESIAESLALRMDEDAARKFLTSFSSFYEK